jgi:hypothetical protein
MRAHLFPHLSVDDFPTHDRTDDALLEAHLRDALNSSSAAVTLLWTRGITVQIASIQVKDLTAGGGWREVLTQQWMDDDGEFSHPLGLFAPGSTLQVMVVAMAMDADVPRAVVAVSSQPSGTVTQIIPSPPTQFDTMQRGTTWAREGKVTV